MRQLKQLKGPSEKRDILGPAPEEILCKVPCPECQGTMVIGGLTTCPEGLPGCEVLHIGIVCKSCFSEYERPPQILAENTPEGPSLGWSVTEEISIG